MESKESSMCPQCVETVAKMEQCIRERPDAAAITSLAAGFILAQIPLRTLMSIVAGVALLVLRPAVVLYGIYRLVDDMYHRPEKEPGKPSAEP
ncbi:MAG: hypothetical protein WCI40_05620 [Verrucomicrobiota bacterium]